MVADQEKCPCLLESVQSVKMAGNQNRGETTYFPPNPSPFSRVKHCQRHNGPEDWVLLTKVTYFSHITRSNTKFDQISSSEYWPSTNFKISTSANISISTKLKIQDIDQTWLQNLNQDSTSLLLQNISSKILTKLQLQILPELQLQNLDQTLCSKSEQKFSFLTKPELPILQQTVANTILTTTISNINNLNRFCLGILTRQGHNHQVY